MMIKRASALLLPLLLTISSYIPFEYLAKSVLVLGAFLVIADPFHNARLLGFVSMIFVFFSNKILRQWKRVHDGLDEHGQRNAKKDA